MFPRMSRSFMHPHGFMVSEFAMAQMMDIVPPPGSEAEAKQLRVYVATQIASANPTRDPRSVAVYADHLVEEIERQFEARKARKIAEQNARYRFRQQAQRLATEDAEVVRLRAERERLKAHRDELDALRPKPPKKNWTNVETALLKRIEEEKAADFNAMHKIEEEIGRLRDKLEKDHYYRLCNEAGIVPEVRS